MPYRLCQLSGRNRVRSSERTAQLRRVSRVGRPSVRYRSTAPDQAPLRMRIRDLAKARVRYGYFRIYILLRREGWRVNHMA